MGGWEVRERAGREKKGRGSGGTPQGLQLHHVDQQAAVEVALPVSKTNNNTHLPAELDCDKGAFGDTF